MHPSQPAGFESQLLESPFGYELLDALVQANINPQCLSTAEWERIVGTASRLGYGDSRLHASSYPGSE